jgi:hypothetical protein
LSDAGEIISPFLRKIVGRRGIEDEHVTSLMIVERYRRKPEPSNPVVAYAGLDPQGTGRSRRRSSAARPNWEGR